MNDPRGKRIHCKGCGRWLFEVDGDGAVVRTRPKAIDLDAYSLEEHGLFEATADSMVRCRVCGETRHWRGQLPTM